MPEKTVLGVDRSATGRRWRPRLDETGERQALALAQRHGLPEIAARVLAGRGVTVESAARELAPSIRALLPDPSTLTDCDALVARLGDAVERGERIVIFADYDVDGATAAAVAARTLRALGAEARIVIPDRLTEGYGPSVPAMERIADEGADVLLCLDCGAGADEPVAAAKRRGIAVLVIDHHPVDRLAPADAIVNPNRPDDLSGLGDLAAVGVAFVAMVGLVREMRRRGRLRDGEPNLLHLLDCVALGTVADVVPLSALNRAFVTRGLTAFRNGRNAGLAALTSVARIGGPVKEGHLGFALGPRINAGGRIGDAGLGARLLTTGDAAEAMRIAELLDRLNADRRALEETALAEAEALAGEGSMVVVAGPWHPGVVGLVAARLKERLRRPAVAIALHEEIGTGSARSVAGVDIGAAIREAAAAGLLVKGGGHRMAAGLTVEAARIGEFAAFLEVRLAADVAAAAAADALSVDAVAALGSLDEPLARLLAGHGPWGQGRPKPILALDAVVVERAVPVGREAVKLTLRALSGVRADAIAFRCGGALGDRLRTARGEPLHLAVELAHGSFRGEARAEIVVVDAADAAVAARRAA